MKRDEDSPLYGPDNKPLAKPASQVDTLVESVKFWQKANAVTLTLLIGGIVWGIVKLPDLIKDKSEQFIKDHLVGSALTNTVEIVISNRAAILVDHRLSPLKEQTVALNNSILETKSALVVISGDISNKQARLSEQQSEIRNEQGVQQLLLQSKAGDLISYKKLKFLAEKKDFIGIIAQAASVDVELFFDSYRNRTYFSRGFYDPISKRKIVMPVEQVLGYLTDIRWTMRETAAFALATINKPSTVPHLCDSLFAETNLFVDQPQVFDPRGMRVLVHGF